jgi:hypothetical protein
MISKRSPNAATAAAMLVFAGVGPAYFFSVPAHASNPRIAPQKIIVCVKKPADPLLVLQRGEMIAGQMFAPIGVEVDWRGTGHSCPAATGQDVPFEISVLTDTNQDYFPGALGLCRPFDRIHGQVFYDRIRTAVEPDTMPYLLAYTLVHEITHLLQGTDWHSDSGVMKARWDGRDFWKMARMQQLPFTEADLLLIHFGLEARKGLLLSCSPMSSEKARVRGQQSVSICGENEP